METQTTLSKEEYQYLKTIDTLNLTIDKLKEKYNELQAESENEKKQLEKQLHLQTISNTALTNTNNKVTQKLEAEILDYKNQVNALNSNLLAVRKLSEEKSGDIKQLIEKNKNYENEMMELELENKELKEEIENFKSEAVYLEERARELKAELRSRFEVYNNQMKQKDAEILTLKTKKISADDIVKEHIVRGSGYVKRADLEKINAIFHNDGIVAIPDSKVVLRKAYLRSDYTFNN